MGPHISHCPPKKHTILWWNYEAWRVVSTHRTVVDGGRARNGHSGEASLGLWAGGLDVVARRVQVQRSRAGRTSWGEPSSAAMRGRWRSEALRCGSRGSLIIVHYCENKKETEKNIKNRPRSSLFTHHKALQCDLLLILRRRRISGDKVRCFN